MIGLWRRRKPELRRDQYVEPQSGRLQLVLGSPRAKDPEVTCGGCRRRPYQIPEYVEAASQQTSASLASPQAMDRYVQGNEGTFNPETNRFLCDECYVRAGTPSNQDGTPWTCP